MQLHLRRLGPALVAAALSLSLVACGGSAAGPGTTRTGNTPAPADYSFFAKEPVSLTVPDKPDPFAVDLRHHDLTKEDLSGREEVLMGYAQFDTRTKWPATLPAGYDPNQIMELGKDPGLGVRQLHQQGITGKGIRVAFLDQTLLVEHQEYKDQIEAYREIGNVPKEAQMHGPAVLSLLAGKTTGVAPEVSVTYYAVDHLQGAKNDPTWMNHAKAIHEILDENNRRTQAERIRIIGVSWGYSPNQTGYKEIKEAVARAKKEGVFVLTTSVEQDWDFRFNGLERAPLADPNDLTAYLPGRFWESYFWQDQNRFANRIMAPMDSRTTASPTGADEYAFYRIGGWSWVVPYLEGLYAMGLQVKPDLTPEEFYKIALETGTYKDVTRDGKTVTFGPIINPVGLITKLQGN
jgi:hypothetical protein